MKDTKSPTILTTKTKPTGIFQLDKEMLFYFSENVNCKMFEDVVENIEYLITDKLTKIETKLDKDEVPRGILHNIHQGT